MKLYEFPSGDTVHKYKKSIVISFKGKRNVLSTGPNNGGFTTDLAAVFNNDANPGDGMEVKLRADTYREHMDILAKEDLGLDPSSCSGLMTVASMDNSAISTPTKLIIEEAASDKLLKASAVTARELKIRPMASFTEKSRTLQKIPTTLASIP